MSDIPMDPWSVIKAARRKPLDPNELLRKLRAEPHPEPTTDDEREWTAIREAGRSPWTGELSRGTPS